MEGLAASGSLGSFAALGVSPYFIETLAGRGISSPTLVQALVSPRLLAGESLFFSSATGTGKTFAYLIPIFQRLLAPAASASVPVPARRAAGGPRALIAAPTYELCSQIKAEADFLLQGAAASPGGVPHGDASPGNTPPLPGRLKAALLIGGGNTARQIDGLRKEKPDILIGNPGRLLQIARLGKLRLGMLEYLVLDEGDRLVSPELAEETGQLLRLIRESRPGGEEKRLLVTACSATLSVKTRGKLLSLLDTEKTPGLLDGLSGNLPGGSPSGFPFIEAQDRSVLGERIQHWAIFSEKRKKIDTLRSFLAAAKPRKALVFIGGAGEPGNILSRLQYRHIAASALFGGMDKNSRKQALDDFRKSRVTVLVSSDLAARGLDIAGISHIIAMDVPQNGDAYIHRAGRTGRMGKAGIMLTIGDAGEMRQLAKLEKKLGIIIYPKELRGGKVAAITEE
ncbi:MAG: DEAD/DEAH box helicase [Treponema sp.]|nr:DEAD/DEAH box helicase [Treponema sp.]